MLYRQVFMPSTLNKIHRKTHPSAGVVSNQSCPIPVKLRPCMSRIKDLHVTVDLATISRSSCCKVQHGTKIRDCMSTPKLIRSIEEIEAKSPGCPSWFKIQMLQAFFAVIASHAGRNALLTLSGAFTASELTRSALRYCRPACFVPL